MDERDNWKSNVLLTGVVVGALAGLGAAYMFTQRAEQEDTRPEMTPGEGVKLGEGDIHSAGWLKIQRSHWLTAF